MMAYLNGKNPPINICTITLRYHGNDGISRAIFFVRHGASNPEAIFLPSIPPNTLRGNPTNNHTIIIRNIVVNGNAYIEKIMIILVIMSGGCGLPVYSDDTRLQN